MPPLTGFSDNPFKTRSDLLHAATALLKPLEQYRSPGKARIRLATATAAGFSETAAQLEGFARPLWVIPSLLPQQCRSTTSPDAAAAADAAAQPTLDAPGWLDGLAAGVDPASPEYWGDVGDHDQRMVEMESIAFALLTAPDQFVPPKSPARDNLAAWLQQVNERRMPENNWRWFRVFVNLALVKVLGVAVDKVRGVMERDLAVLDSFYLGEGWSSDGLWGEERKQADYYSGSFALQFAQLLYVRFSDGFVGFDSERVERYRTQAGEFAAGFWRYFDANGAAIPFGRSLTYRYAFAAFWAAVAFADVPLPAPLDQPGVVKGLLFRHLRWWARQPDIFNTDGTHNIGYTYPNMYLSENYTSSQSVYWCLKSFIVLHLPKDHPFWAAPELPHPSTTQPAIAPLRPPYHILCNLPEHHFLLSAGQSTKKDHKAREAKYGKFAYSSAFGFSVPSGPLLGQFAPDSTLCLSRDGGESWKVAWEPYNVRFETLNVGDEQLPALISRWRPWRDVELHIETTLVSPTKKWTGWHFQMHKLVWDPADLAAAKVRSLDCIDAGFSISAQQGQFSIFERDCEGLKSLVDAKDPPSYGWWAGTGASLVMSEAGASGTAALTVRPPAVSHPLTSHGCKHTSQATVLRPDANTNIIAPRTLLPCVRHSFHFSSDITKGVDGSGLASSGLPNRAEATFGLGVFGIVASPEFGTERQRAAWIHTPSELVFQDATRLEIK